MSTSMHPRFPVTPGPGSPSASSTPVHSIQTIRRKAAGHHGPLTKILVANRGVRTMTLCLSRTLYLWTVKEIAIRVFRTAHELAMHTVAIFSYEDRMSAHRQKVSKVTPIDVCSNISIFLPLSRRMKRTKLARDSPRWEHTSPRTTSSELHWSMA